MTAGAGGEAFLALDRVAHSYRLGGRLLGFNIDPSFGYCLDGLILVDLTKTDPTLLAKYMGRENLERFLAFHAATP